MQGHYLVAIRLLGGDFVSAEMIWWGDAGESFGLRGGENATLPWACLLLSQAQIPPSPSPLNTLHAG